MKPKQVIMLGAVIGVLCITVFILLTSPLTAQLTNAGSLKAKIDAVVGLFLGVTMIAGVAAFSITFIIACCYLAKRLGYEMSSGLRLLIPVVNLVIFFSWAFCESPNERQLRQSLQRRP